MNAFGDTVRVTRLFAFKRGNGNAVDENNQVQTPVGAWPFDRKLVNNQELVVLRVIVVDISDTASNGLSACKLIDCRPTAQQMVTDFVGVYQSFGERLAKRINRLSNTGKAQSLIDLRQLPAQPIHQHHLGIAASLRIQCFSGEVGVAEVIAQQFNGRFLDFGVFGALSTRRGHVVFPCPVTGILPVSRP